MLERYENKNPNKVNTKQKTKTMTMKDEKTSTVISINKATIKNRGKKVGTFKSNFQKLGNNRYINIKESPREEKIKLAAIIYH